MKRIGIKKELLLFGTVGFLALQGPLVGCTCQMESCGVPPTALITGPRPTETPASTPTPYPAEYFKAPQLLSTQVNENPALRGEIELEWAMNIAAVPDKNVVERAELVLARGDFHVQTNQMGAAALDALEAQSLLGRADKTDDRVPVFNQKWMELWQKAVTDPEFKRVIGEKINQVNRENIAVVLTAPTDIVRLYQESVYHADKKLSADKPVNEAEFQLWQDEKLNAYFKTYSDPKGKFKMPEVFDIPSAFAAYQKYLALGQGSEMAAKVDLPMFKRIMMTYAVPLTNLSDPELQTKILAKSIAESLYGLYKIGAVDAAKIASPVDMINALEASLTKEEKAKLSPDKKIRLEQLKQKASDPKNADLILRLGFGAIAQVMAENNLNFFGEKSISRVPEFKSVTVSSKGPDGKITRAVFDNPIKMGAVLAPVLPTAQKTFVNKPLLPNTLHPDRGTQQVIIKVALPSSVANGAVHESTFKYDLDSGNVRMQFKGVSLAILLTTGATTSFYEIDNSFVFPQNNLLLASKNSAFVPVVFAEDMAAVGKLEGQHMVLSTAHVSMVRDAGNELDFSGRRWGNLAENKDLMFLEERDATNQFLPANLPPGDAYNRLFLSPVEDVSMNLRRTVPGLIDPFHKDTVLEWEKLTAARPRSEISQYVYRKPQTNVTYNPSRRLINHEPLQIAIYQKQTTSLLQWLNLKPKIYQGIGLEKTVQPLPVFRSLSIEGDVVVVKTEGSDNYGLYLPETLVSKAYVSPSEKVDFGMTIIQWAMMSSPKTLLGGQILSAFDAFNIPPHVAAYGILESMISANIEVPTK